MKYLLPIAVVSGALLLLKGKKSTTTTSNTVDVNADTQVTSTQKENRKVTFVKS